MASSALTSCTLLPAESSKFTYQFITLQKCFSFWDFVLKPVAPFLKVTPRKRKGKRKRGKHKERKRKRGERAVLQLQIR